LVPIMGMLICTAMILALPAQTLLMALGWMVIGLVIYFSYSKANSVLRGGKN